MAHSISGTISGSLSGVIVSAGGKVATSSAGSYSIAAVPDGLVTVIPNYPGYSFSPPSYTFILSANVTGVNFTATAITNPWFTTNFQLRSGSTTFKPHDAIGQNIMIEKGEEVKIERGELADYTLADYFIGWKQVVKATFQVLYSKVITPAGGYSSLEAVLNARSAGVNLEYSVDGGSTWVFCRLTGDPPRDKIDGKNVGETMTVELESLGLVASPWKVS